LAYLCRSWLAVLAVADLTLQVVYPTKQHRAHPFGAFCVLLSLSDQRCSVGKEQVIESGSTWSGLW